MKKVFDIIFVQNKCSIKFVSLYESEFDIVFPYLLDPSQHSLKQLELDITFNEDNSYKIDKDTSSNDALSSQHLGYQGSPSDLPIAAIQKPDNHNPLASISSLTDPVPSSMLQDSFLPVQNSFSIYYIGGSL
uniref:Uncharacterized protein n=1 Tax=Amphimedon queenslandica TaxID=400682 RepID=A0A1X7TS98_AMPQE